jgi:hypothetical protein
MNIQAPEAVRPDIELRVERVVLDGLPIQSHDRAAVGAAVEAELRRLLAQGGWDASVASVALPSLRADGIQWSAADGANQLGAQIARAVFGALTGSVVGQAQKL